EVVTGTALARLEPALAAGLWACRVDMGFPVHPGASTYAYATLAERRGALVRSGRSASLDRSGDDVVGVIVDGRRLACDAVLVAAGPWSPAIIDASGIWTPIRHRWGVVVEVELADDPRHVLEEAEIGAIIGPDARPMPIAGYGRPSRPTHDEPAEALLDFSLVPLPGMASVGSTFLARQPEPAAWVEPILGRASALLPAVADAPIRGTRSCARPQSADGRPLIGRAPGRNGLFICAGHGSWGISTGPASARLVVDQILGREPEIAAELDAARFGSPP
ncbi:MAG TPA: FAD-binding oxidoreductase, partial [Candidatus Saccharimonadia bacterium]|nr:FAD-binding oxidoreductase [Candidatus Saccharimonadia bacterium]